MFRKLCLFGRQLYTQAAAAHAPPKANWSSPATPKITIPDMGTEKFANRMATARIIYDSTAYQANSNSAEENTTPFSLLRTITKTAYIDVGASLHGVMLDGSPWPGQAFFMSLKPGDPRGLSPEERVLAKHKIIASSVMAYQFGGYPLNNPIRKLKNPREVTVLSQSGVQLEHPQLDYANLFFDAYQNRDLYETAHRSLLTKGFLTSKADIKFIRPSLLTYLCRDPRDGHFYRHLSNHSAVIFHSDAYYETMLRCFKLTFAAALQLADPNKNIYIKFPLVGLGHFAQVGGTHNISEHLLGPYLRAISDAIASTNDPRLQVIEVPIFDNNHMDTVNFLIENISLSSKISITLSNDVLDIDRIDDKKFHICIVNPSDANSMPGNELAYTSVESAIGNNTDLRYMQNCYLNHHLLNPSNWIAINPSHSLVEEPSTSPRP